MFLMLPAFFAIHLVLLQDAGSCEMWEYSIREECCPKCDAGHRVLRHCTSSSSTSCVSCNHGWYMDHPNGLSSCFKCQECDPGAHLQIKEQCHYWKNTKCTCQPGFFCFHPSSEDSCDMCVKHTIAPPGFRVLQAGTEMNDTKFEACPPGTFSAREMSFSCAEWTNCNNEGLLEKQAGNATTDAVCGAHLMNIAPILVPITVCLLLLLLLSIGIWKNRTRIMKAMGRKKVKKAEELHPTNPEKEYMAIPIQETTQNLGQPSYARP